MSRILVVDDDTPTRESLARLLMAGGHDAVAAANGRDGWLTFYEGVPDLVLLDLMMPQMDGITFLKLLRRSDHWSRVPVIVVTGFTDHEGLVSEARQLGVADVVAKAGCAPERLLSLVEKALARPMASSPAHPAPGHTGRRRTACGVA